MNNFCLTLRLHPLSGLAIVAALCLMHLGSAPAAAQRVPWVSHVQGSPEPPPPLVARRVEQELKFEQPLYLACEPTTGRLFVVQRQGQVLSCDRAPGQTAAQLHFDVQHDLYSLAFHPQYANNHYVYVFGNDALRYPGEIRTEVPRNRLLRYTLVPGATPEETAATQLEILAWESNGHNGGEIVFDEAGLLYLTTGDSTSSSDPKETGQNLSDLLSVMIRIDVDQPAPGQHYSVPADNPFVDVPGARPEIWAYGFRNPWRLHRDSATGTLYVGDIGQDLWEMIYVVRRGGNYGWSVREGSHPFVLTRPTGPTDFDPPIAEHPHSEARSIVGGLVYRGDKFPELRGAYLYGDYETGRMWGLRYVDGQVAGPQELASTQVKFLDLEEDPEGEVWLSDFFSGELFRLERAPPPDPSLAEFPRLLSQTGLFTDVASQTPAPGVLPYDVNSPLWSDGAHKQRWLALPGETTIDYQPTSAWGLPDGAVLVKSFALDVLRDGQPRRELLETRLLVKQQGQWQGYTYLWNAEQTDAELAPAGALDREYLVADPAQPSGTRTQVWHFPSRAECMMCHSRAANWILGIQTGQLNRTFDHGGEALNQIEHYAQLGLFTSPPDVSAGPPAARLPDPADESVALEDRVASYLHANCSHCHVDDGGGNSRMQLTYFTPWAGKRLLDARPQHDGLGLASPLLVAPGEVERSLLYQRIVHLGTARMPRLASSVIDQQAAALIRAWIASLPQVAVAPEE